jgi:molybdopterin/thiamine biosynthesis adenylyltransferase
MRAYNKLSIVGCGGVGSYLAQILRKLYPKAELIFIDGDIFENGNLDRQFFNEDDVGKNKAETLTAYYNGRAIPEYLSETTQLPPLDVMFVCVDNHKARRDALGLADKNRFMVIVCANEEVDSQAYVYERKMKNSPQDPRVRYNLADVPPPVASCTAHVNTQTPLANVTAAILGVRLFYTWTNFRHTLPDTSYLAIEHNVNQNVFTSTKVGVL